MLNTKNLFNLSIILLFALTLLTTRHLLTKNPRRLPMTLSFRKLIPSLAPEKKPK